MPSKPWDLARTLTRCARSEQLRSVDYTAADLRSGPLDEMHPHLVEVADYDFARRGIPSWYEAVVLVSALLPDHPVDGNCTSDNIWQALADVIHVKNQVAQTLAVIL
jgi:hypothetical protein